MKRAGGAPPDSGVDPFRSMQTANIATNRLALLQTRTLNYFLKIDFTASGISPPNCSSIQLSDPLYPSRVGLPWLQRRIW
jgi:hypothetical protein